MEYIIVQQDSLDNQIEAVNLKLEDGWECIGGLCTVYIPINQCGIPQLAYTQAMIKKPYKDPFRTGMP